MPEITSVAAVVVTYNRKTLLSECIQALLHQQLPEAVSLDLLVVDNASTDGTDDMVKPMARQNDRIHYLPLTKNLGGAGGFHYGMKWAAEQGYDYIWIMDDDTIPEEEALANLLKGASLADDFGYVSSTVLWTDGSFCKMNRQHELEPATDWQKQWKEDAGLIPVDQATFVSLLFPAEVVRQMGLPIKEYFIWGDDKEYTLRLAAKYPCYRVKDSMVVHKMAQNTGSNITYDEVNRISRYYYAYRNDLATAKSRGAKDVVIYFAAFVLNMFRVLLHSRDGKKERISIMFKGMRAGLDFHPEIEFADVEKL